MRPRQSAPPAVDLARLSQLIDLFSNQTIVLLGDFVADEFVFGDISRVSREAPVLIVRKRERQFLPGGGANAANNLADLGAKVLAVSALGDDEAGEALRAYFQTKNVSTAGLVKAAGWQTPTKTRFLAGWPHTTKQQVLRVDSEPVSHLADAVIRTLIKKASANSKSASAVLLSDYGYGSATPEIISAVYGSKRSNLPLVLDSRYRLLDYKKLSITAATPNEAEVEAAYHTRIGETKQLEELGQQTLSKLDAKALVITRGRDGMMVFEKGATPRNIPIYGSDQALDVTGAGDTVIAVLTLALAAGANILEAAQLATYAGGIVVMKRGTATVTRGELAAAIRAEVTGESAERRH